ncbi:MAG: GDSL-type esterase/lipase family protein [Pseudomonadota bacterium]
MSAIIASLAGVISSPSFRWVALTMMCACWLLPAQAQTTRVLIVGDSWAEEQWLDGAHQRVFTANGLSQFNVDGATTTESGSTAAEWSTPGFLQRIGDALNAQPTIDTVQLTVGGNDFLDAWTVNLSASEVMTLQMDILDDLIVITDFILSQRPDIEVLLSFYDYPNFVDTLGGITGLFFCQPLLNDLGNPTPLQINRAANDFIGVYALLADDPRIQFVDHAGLMQFAFGFPDQGIQPGDLKPPGDLNRPTPQAALRTRLAPNDDCFHLSANGYDVLVGNLFDQYLLQRLDGVFRSGFESQPSIP